MPYEGTLYEFLNEMGLEQYHQDFVSQLGVTAIDHLAYVQTDDVLQLGMTAPEWRRLKASMKKVRKGKFKPAKNTKVSKTTGKPTIVRVPSQQSTPTGGHIIPASTINVLDRELGRGEFGRVLQGIWTDKDGQKIQVAVKCLNQGFSADKSQDFLKEAAIMCSLNHDNLVKLYGVVLDADISLMLVTEYAALRSLLENIKQPTLRASFPITLLLEFAGQIADAMRYLHLSNIIHRDLATRNILLFVDEEGTKKVKISDFGLSRRLIYGENYRSEMTPNLKLPLAWMPVEALTKLTFTKASDVWSFGVTMWEMFTYGRQPWATHSGEEILKAIDKPELQRLARPDACPVKIYEILQKCWKHEPEKRPTFAEICEELPKAKPVQVRAITNYKPTKAGELAYRGEDIITVLDSNENTGIWNGILANGKIGTFLRCNTTLMGSNNSNSTTTGGSRLRRWKSGFRSDKRDARKSRLTVDAIGTPMGARHIFHVGPDGSVQGDATFGGDYRTLPPDAKVRQPWSSSSSVSSASSASTRSPPHSPYRANPPPPGLKSASSATLPPSRSNPALQPRSSTLQRKPKTNGELTSSTPDLLITREAEREKRTAPSCAQSNEEVLAPEPISEPISEPVSKPVPEPVPEPAPVTEATVDNSRTIVQEKSSVVPKTQLKSSNVPSSVATSTSAARSPSPDDSLSLSLNLEMGSLLDEFMCEWDDRRNTVDEQDTSRLLQRTPMDDRNKNWDLGAGSGDRASSSSSTSGNTPRPGSLQLSSSPGSEGGRTCSSGMAVLRSSSKKKRGAAAGVVFEGKESPTNMTPLHNMIIKDSPSNPAKTFRRPQSTSGTPSTNTGATGGDLGGASPDDSCRRSETPPEVTLRVNLNRARSLRDRKDDINFVRLSTSPPQKAENDYIDTIGLVKSNPNSPVVDGLSSRQPFSTSMSTSSTSSSERTSSPPLTSLSQKISSGEFSSPNEYEELCEATSEPPKDVPRPTKLVTSNRDLQSREVARSKSVRVPVTRPPVEDPPPPLRGQIGRSVSLKETATSFRAQDVYAKLIGGRIGGPQMSSKPSHPVSSSPLRTASPGRSKNPFLDGSPTQSPSLRHRMVLERLSSVDSSDGSTKDGWRNSTSDRDSRELQFGPGDPLNETTDAVDPKDEKTFSVKALLSKFDKPTLPPRQPPEIPRPKASPPKVPPRSQKPTPPHTIKTTANIVLHSGKTHSPKGLNNNYSPDGQNVTNLSSPDIQTSSDVKLSPKTIQGLERSMPRRVRRSIGEARIKRRGSSDVSDSDNEPTHIKLDSEADNFSQDATGERSTIDSVFGSEPSRMLPDLPEDQTNRQSANYPLPLPPRDPTMHPTHALQSNTAMSPGFNSDVREPTLSDNEVERVDLADFAQDRPRTSSTDSDSESGDDRYMPLPSRPDQIPKSDVHTKRNPLTRGHTIDVPVIPKRHSANLYFGDGTPARPPLLTSRSLDASTASTNGMNNHMRASPEDIRKLLRQNSASKNGTLAYVNYDDNDDDDDNSDLSDNDNQDYVFCRFATNDLNSMPRSPLPSPDDLSDMPRRPPPAPPVPIHNFATTQSNSSSPQFNLSLDYKVPAPQGPMLRPKQPSQLIREAEYEIMKPQRDSAFFSEVKQASQSSLEQDLSLRELPPLPPIKDPQPRLLTRSGSAHSTIPSSDQLRGRRGTLASTSRSETLKEIDQGNRNSARLERKSRSFEELPDDESGLKEAESLNDVLARTYKSPPIPVASSHYVSPRSYKHLVTQHLQQSMVHPQTPKDPSPPSSTATVNNYSRPPRLPHRPSEDYIDMSHQKKKTASKLVNKGTLPPDGEKRKALDVQTVKRELPDEVTVEDCTQVLKENLWNVPLSTKILKVRFLMRTLLLDESTCRQALVNSNWDLCLATAIIGEMPEPSISL